MALLHEDARRTLADIAEHVTLSTAAVERRRSQRVTSTRTHIVLDSWSRGGQAR